jgi:hypothetical protein
MHHIYRPIAQPSFEDDLRVGAQRRKIVFVAQCQPDGVVPQNVSRQT